MIQIAECRICKAIIKQNGSFKMSNAKREHTRLNHPEAWNKQREASKQAAIMRGKAAELEEAANIYNRMGFLE